MEKQEHQNNTEHAPSNPQVTGNTFTQVSASIMKVMLVAYLANTKLCKKNWKMTETLA